MNKQEYLELLGTDENNAAAITIWNALEQNGYEILKKNNPERYIMSFEDQQNYLAEEVTDADRKAVNDGILSITRSSDCKSLTWGGNWVDLPKWES